MDWRISPMPDPTPDPRDVERAKALAVDIHQQMTHSKTSRILLAALSDVRREAYCQGIQEERELWTDDPDPRGEITALRARVEELEEENDRLTARVAEIEDDRDRVDRLQRAAKRAVLKWEPNDH
jgi:hypothetical protein